MTDIPLLLLHGDVDAIKEYVYETSSLPQIRGGSQILIDCEEAVRTLLAGAGGKEIYCNGGSFLFLIPADQADNLAEQVRQIYLRRTMVATVTVVTETVRDASNGKPHASGAAGSGWAARLLSAQPPGQSAFSRRLGFLAADLRLAKAKRTSPPFYESLPFGQRCQECGKRMARQQVRRGRGGADEPAPDVRAMCPVCLERFERGKHSSDNKPRGRINQKFASQYSELRSRQPYDLSEIAEGSKRKYLAFLYADGNSIGSLLRQVADAQQLSALSGALVQGLEQALFKALRQVCAPVLEKEGSIWPFEIIHVGGDDVAVILEAGYAWEVGVAFLNAFQTETRSSILKELGSWPANWPDQLTASCGIIYAGESYPVRYMQRLAVDLLRRAKQCAKQNPGQSAIDFFWLTSDIASERAEPLLEVYKRVEGARIDLTARPYTLEKAEYLQSLIQKANEIGPSQRHFWSEALRTGVDRSLNAIYYNIARQSSDKREIMKDFLQESISLLTSDQKDLPPWVLTKDQEDNIWRTSVVDIFELTDLHGFRATEEKEKPAIPEEEAQ